LARRPIQVAVDLTFVLHATPPGPADEQFDSSKKQGFNGDLLKAVIPTVAQGIKSVDSLSEFKDFNDVLRLYRKVGGRKGWAAASYRSKACWFSRRLPAAGA
jgi:hypothetical protein